jgi:hypothetical protein
MATYRPGYTKPFEVRYTPWDFRYGPRHDIPLDLQLPGNARLRATYLLQFDEQHPDALPCFAYGYFHMRSRPPRGLRPDLPAFLKNKKNVEKELSYRCARMHDQFPQAYIINFILSG